MPLDMTLNSSRELDEEIREWVRTGETRKRVAFEFPCLTQEDLDKYFSMKFVVLTNINGNWENVWADDGEPTIFNSYEEAEEELEEFLADTHEMGYTADDYRIAEYNPQ